MWGTPDLKYFFIHLKEFFLPDRYNNGQMEYSRGQIFFTYYIWGTTDGNQIPCQSFRVYSHIELELLNIIFQQHRALQMAHISGKMEVLY